MMIHLVKPFICLFIDWDPHSCRESICWSPFRGELTTLKVPWCKFKREQQNLFGWMCCLCQLPWGLASPPWFACLKHPQLRGIGSWIIVTPFTLPSGLLWPSDFYGCGWQLLVHSKVHGIKKILEKCLLNDWKSAPDPEITNRWKKRKELNIWVPTTSVYTYIFYFI